MSQLMTTVIALGGFKGILAREVKASGVLDQYSVFTNSDPAFKNEYGYASGSSSGSGSRS